MLVRDVVLLTTTETGEVALPGLTISASENAVAVSGPAHQVMRSWPRSEVSEINADGQQSAAGGPTLQVLELCASGRRHRFLVAAPDLAPFLRATAGMCDPGGRSRSRPWTPWATRWREHATAMVRRPRHSRVLKVRPVPACIGMVVLIGGGATLGAIGTGGAQAADPVGGGGGGVSIMSRMAKEFANRATAVALPAAAAAPAPAPPSLAGSPALHAHEIFGFAPYWTLPEAAGFDVADLTTLAYFSLDVNGNGSIQNSGSGWTGYQSQDLADLITRSHAAGARVVLTVTCFGQAALNELTSDPASATRLASSLVPLIAAKNLDGVNFDFEGEGNADQAGLDSLIAQVSAAVKSANPHWQVTMDTYASSAGDPGGFYDIAGLAKSVDAFFVMAYDMNATTPSPTAALTGSGFTDLEALQEYTKVVPPSKVILGVPYYGYDWPTAGPGLGAAATGGPSPLSYAQIAKAKHPVYWDATTQTAWTSYQVGSQWHQTWYDDATSLALKAELADFFHVAGVGVWALGMDGNDPTMLAALLGRAPVVKNFVAGPGTKPAPGTSSTTTTTGPSGAAYSYSGVWDQSPVTLTAVVPASLPDNGEAVPAGVLSGFTTDDPRASCLMAGGILEVSELVGEPGVFLVTAPTPPDCAGGSWIFTPTTAAGGGSGAGGGGGGSGSSTTTTTAGTTTSTSTSTTTTTSTTSTTTTTTTTPTTTTTTGP